MDEVLQTRIAENEAAFRRINEAIEQGHWPGADDEPRGTRSRTPAVERLVRGRDHTGMRAQSEIVVRRE